jgi:glycosyltransferase involved in cell wall biosynthesis
LAVTAEAVARRDPDALAANHAALVEAMLDVIAARPAWAERRGEIRAYARRELAPERMAGAYARVLRRVAGRSPG